MFVCHSNFASTAVRIKYCLLKMPPAKKKVKTISNYFSSNVRKRKKQDDCIKTAHKKSNINITEPIVISSDEDDDFKPTKIMKPTLIQTPTRSTKKTPIKIHKPSTSSTKTTRINKISTKIKDHDKMKNTLSSVNVFNKLMSRKPPEAKEETPNEDTEIVIDDNNLPEGNSKFYLENFITLLDYVLNNEADKSLFVDENCNDLHWAEKFKTLPIQQQMLYCRLFHRKASWIPLEKISYRDICHEKNTSVHLGKLKQEGYVAFLPDALRRNEVLLADALALLPLDSLKTIAKDFHIKQKQKFDIIPALLQLSKKQNCVLSGSMDQILIKKIAKLAKPYYKLSNEPKRAFNRFLLVFDVTRGIDDDIEGSCSGSVSKSVYSTFGSGPQQLSTMILTGIGRLKYPAYEVDRPSQVFRHRSHLLEYEHASQLHNEVAFALEGKKDFKVAEEICLNVLEVYKNTEVELVSFVEQQPQFLQCFSSVYVHIRTLVKLVEIYEKQKQHDKAVEIIRFLIQQPFCKGYRGKLWERIALNLHTHLKKPKDALNAISEAFDDDHLRVGHTIALAQRAQKILQSKFAKSVDLTIEKEKLTHALGHLNFTKCPEITITGKQLRLERSTGFTSRFILESKDVEHEGTICSVEELALEHYKCEGYDGGLHAEGRTFFTFLCLIMWDIIFMPGIPDVFRTKYQTHPLDFYTDDFYHKRKTAIEDRLELIERSIEIGDNGEENVIFQMLEMNWEEHYGEACAGITWNLFNSPKHAWSLIGCLGGKVLSCILRRMVTDTRRTRSGIPDLIVWNTKEKTHKFSEVKGPGDKLSTNQILWLHQLLSYGADAEVCYVKAVAAKAKNLL